MEQPNKDDFLEFLVAKVATIICSYVIIAVTLIAMFEETKATYQKLASEYELSRSPAPTNNKLPTKREMAKEVTRLTKVCGLGKKEANLLKILSNFELKRTKELTNEVPTEDYKHLKGALDKKIRMEGWFIKTDKGKGLNPDSFYSLAKLPMS